jgi:hypothetical protein
VLFAIINAIGMVFADPLTPTMQDQLAAFSLLVTGAIRVADEEHMGGETLASQCRGQIIYTHAEAPSRGIAIGTLKAEDDKDRILGRDALLSHGVFKLPFARCILACDTSVHNRSIGPHSANGCS